MKRNKVLQHEFISKNNKNTVIVANTKDSNIKWLINDNEYKDKLYKLLKTEYKKNLKNTNIYILWDRDKDDINDKDTQRYYKNAIETFTNSLDNRYEMNGLLLLSYPCYESYNLSNFNKRFQKKTYRSSNECKKEFYKSKYYIKNIDEKTLLLAAYNMHKSLINYGIYNYDLSDFKRINETIFRKEEETYKSNRYFNA